MATIRTAFALTDQMTRPIQHINSAMGILINSMESMSHTMGTNLDTSALEEARNHIADATAAFDQLEDEISQAGQQQERLNQNIRAGQSAADGLLQKFAGIAATIGGMMGLKQLVGLSDDLAGTRARLNLIVDDGGSVADLEKKIMASAQRSRAAYFDTANAIASMGANAKSAFSGNDELIAFMEQINKQFVIGGASAQGQAAAMMQLTQAMGAGALRGEELNSILENAPGIARAIEQYMGVAEGSIKKYAEEGLITAEVVKNAMFAAADETNAKFETMPKTWAQIWTSMKNRALSVLNPLLTKINELMNSAQFTQVTDALLNAFVGLAEAGSFVLDLLISIASAVVDNWSWLSPIIYGVAGALLFYAAATKGVAIAEGIATAAKYLAVPAYALLTGATMADTAAQWGLNGALYACPLVWIIILIIALVALFYAAVAAVNHFAGTSVSATGIICGAFMAALAFIGNIFIVLYNLVVDVFVMIYNLVATVANFIGNVFNDPVGAVCRLFFDLADTVLSVLQSLASAIDTIFGSNLSGAVQGWRDSLGGWVDSTFGKGTEVMSKLDADPLHLGRFEYGKAFDMGYNFGEGIDNKISGMFDFPGADSMGAGSGLDLGGGMGQYNLGNAANDIAGSSADTAGNTAAMADTLDYMEEDLKYMLDIAEREAINRFTTAEIKVEQHNENHIDGDTDLDGIMDAWATDFAEKLDISEEGVN